MKALVSGANGFLGSHLCRALLSRKWEVIKLPRELLSTSKELEEFCGQEKPDYIFHLASYGNMADQKGSGEIIGVNVLGTYSLLYATRNLSYKAFVNFGSSSEYGKKHCPMMESDTPTTDTFYGASKVAATYIARAFAKQCTKPIVTVRPFSVYGPGEATFRFIPTIIQNLTKGTLMDVDISGVHDWIYVDDLISGVLMVADNARELFGQVVNIGTGKQTDNMGVISFLEKISEKSLNINYFSNMRTQDSPIWVDGSKKLRLFGWRPRISLQEGLKRTYEYYTK